MYAILDALGYDVRLTCEKRETADWGFLGMGCLEDAGKQIPNREYEACRQVRRDKLYGRIFTPDGLRIICASFDNDPEKIGKHTLETLAKL